MFVIGYHQNESSQQHTQNLTIERQNSYGIIGMARHNGAPSSLFYLLFFQGGRQQNCLKAGEVLTPLPTTTTIRPSVRPSVPLDSPLRLCSGVVSFLADGISPRPGRRKGLTTLVLCLHHLRGGRMRESWV